MASLLVTEVDSDGEEENTLADLNQSAEPALDHLSVIQISQLSQVFQRVSKLFGANLEGLYLWSMPPEVLLGAPTPGCKAPKGGGGDAAPGGDRAIAI